MLVISQDLAWKLRAIPFEILRGGADKQFYSLSKFAK